jgi:hypothetical protein
MKPWSQEKFSEMLSLYVDGELDEQQARELEEYLATHPDAAKELRELRAMKRLLTSKKLLPETLGFWTRLSGQLDRKEREQENLLPFPRKYLPIVVSAGAFALVVVGLLIFQQRSRVIEYVSRQSERVQKAVEDNVLKGSILPLFSNVDRNQVLQFALFGTLPLDAKTETSLRVDENAERGYTIDVGKKPSGEAPPVTVDEFVQQVKPTRAQRKVIDSVLDLGRERIERSGFFAEDRGIAIDPNLPQFNRVMLSSIAASLESVQRVRLQKFLEERKARYTIGQLYGKAETPERIYRGIPQTRRNERFLVVTPDTLAFSRLQVDMDSLQRHFRRVADSRHQVGVNVDGLIRRFAEREAAMKKQFYFNMDPIRVLGDSDVLSIEIGTAWEGLQPVPREWMVKPAARGPRGGPRPPRGPSFNFRFDGNDSSFYFNLDLDSLLIRMQKEGPEAGFEFFKGDPRARDRGVRVRIGGGFFNMDSLARAGSRAHAIVDSLMKLMEEKNRDVREQQKRKDDDDPLDR